MEKCINVKLSRSSGMLQKLRRVTTATMALLLAFVISVQASTYSESVKFDLKMKKASLKEVFQTITDQSEFKFVYNNDVVNDNQKVSVSTEDARVEEILDEILPQHNLDYKVVDRQVIVYPAEKETEAIDSEAQQGNTINGKVIDTDGLPLPGVSVIVKGTTIGIVTNPDGEYSLEVPADAQVLIFSFVGMRAEEVIIGNKTTINVTMEAEAIGLEEVVAIGYGTEKKATITGSVAGVKGEDLKKSPALNISNNLVGRTPGLIALNRSGEPGYDGSDLLIRGSNTLNDNTPLVVVDGITGRDMNRIDPADIESVSILKDASAAIYGAQAANGVILITTKRGKIGKPTITINMNQGFNQPTRVPDMADAATYAEMINEINIYRDRDPIYTEDDLQKYRDGSAPWTHPNTDWYDATFKTWSPQTYGNISISGGSQEMRYYVSMGANHQDGIYENSATSYNQYDFRANLDGKVSEHINFAVDVSGRQENRNFPTRSAGAIFRMLMRGKPNLPAYWPDGTPGPDIEYGDNPVVIVTDETGYNKDTRYIFDSNMKLDIEIPWVKGLTLTANAAIDKRMRKDKVFQKGWYLYSWDYETYGDDGKPALIKGKRGFDDPRLRQEFRDQQNITLNGLLNYETTIGEDHSLKFLAGIERFKGDEMNFWAYRRYFVTDQIDQMFAGGDLEKDNSGSASETARLNYFGRVNYRLKDKYLAEFVWRYDGSYIFPEDSRFGFFPGISLGWRISEENFWKENLGFIENFKLRASIGQTGNDRIDPFQFMSSYGFNSNGWTYIFNESVESKVLTESRIPNPAVTWEIATQKNIGIDGQMLDGKLYFEADYFHNFREDILWWRNASVPESTGLSLPRENIGEVVNQGFEFNVSYRDNIGDFSYQVGINGGYQKNRIEFWDETPGIPDYQKSTGKPMDTDLYYETDGIFHTQAEVDAYPHWAGARPGDVKFVDVNDDGAIDGLDRVRIDKNNIPRFQGGVTANLAYKNFDLAMLFQGAFGAVQYIDTESGEIGNFLQFYAEDRWTPDNPDGSTPRAWNRNEEYWRNNNNTYFLRSTDYVRLKNLELGYNFSPNVCSLLGVDALRLYFNGANLFVFDSFDVFDPEGDSASGQSYPQNRTINAGVTVTF